MRLAFYGVASTLLTAAVLYTNFLTPTHSFPPFRRSNFYTSAIYLSNSSASLLVLLNFGIFGTLLWGKVLQSIFFGPLRAIEVEHLYERSWFAVTETCLAMTIFREEFDAPFVTLFVALLFTKIFHWLCQDRVDFVSPLFHLRMVTLMANLLIADTLFVAYSVKYTMENGANMLIVFGFEYAILVAVLLATFFKYVVHMIDSRTDEAWENKSMYIFYLELVTDFMKLMIYLIFFVVVVKFYSVPLHIIRDIYVTLRSFLQKCRDLVRYRQATRNMNERYPDATMDELSRMSDPTCIICREEMVHRDDATARQRMPTPVPTPREGRPAMAADVPKKLPCGHIFHFSCLRSWLERQQSCPTCRSPVLNTEQATPQPQAQPQAQQLADLLGQPQAPQAAQPPQPPQSQDQPPPQPPVDQPASGSSSQEAPQSTQVEEVVQPTRVRVRAVPGQAMPGVIPLGDLEVPPGGDGIRPFRLQVMPPLTDDDVTRLASGTREAISRRLELINRTQAHLIALSTVLTQALTIPVSTTEASAERAAEASSQPTGSTSGPVIQLRAYPEPEAWPISDHEEEDISETTALAAAGASAPALGGTAPGNQRSPARSPMSFGQVLPNVPLALSSDSDDSEYNPAIHDDSSITYDRD